MQTRKIEIILSRLTLTSSGMNSANRWGGSDQLLDLAVNFNSSTYRLPPRTPRQACCGPPHRAENASMEGRGQVRTIGSISDIATCLVDRTDVRVVQGRGGAGFLEQAGGSVFVLLRQHLDGDRALAFRRLRRPLRRSRVTQIVASAHRVRVPALVGFLLVGVLIAAAGQRPITTTAIPNAHDAVSSTKTTRSALPENEKSFNIPCSFHHTATRGSEVGRGSSSLCVTERGGKRFVGNSAEVGTIFGSYGAPDGSRRWRCSCGARAASCPTA